MSRGVCIGTLLDGGIIVGRPALLDVRIDPEVWAPDTNFETIVPRDV